MTISLPIRTISIAFLVLLIMTAFIPQAATAQEMPESVAYGDYAVGTVTAVAVDNRQRFDPWNGAYGRPAYRDLLSRVEAAGQKRTVVFQLWYPAVPDTSQGRLNGPRSPYPAASGQRIGLLDFYFQDGDLALQIAQSQVLSPNLLHLQSGGTLADASGLAQQVAFLQVGRGVLRMPRGAWKDADIAEGRFPVIVLAHGLGGTHAMWSTLAEFLVSHGYVVAAPTFISDSGMPLVFHDEDSPFAQSSSPEEVQQAYQMIMGDFKVIPSFYSHMFGVDASGGFEALQNFNPAQAQIVPGGIHRTTTMMQNLFRQRVSDVGLVLHTVRQLDAEQDTCRIAQEAMGATSSARNLCGLFTGHIDSERVGVGGHSLGSMTAQFAVNHLPGVSAAMGINNGPPFTWTPEEFFGAGTTQDGLPAGSRKPVLQLIGDEDDFVQNVFVDLFQAAVSLANGDPAEAFPLASERALPDRMDNPQPVALSAYMRAMSDRALVIVRNADHGTLVEDFDRLFPWPEFQAGNLPFAMSPARTRKPTGEAAFGPPGAQGESFDQLGWAETEDDGFIYMPHVIRDWYVRAWFDWYLKGNQEAHDRLQATNPFGDLTSVRSDIQ